MKVICGIISANQADANLTFSHRAVTESSGRGKY